jgi:hypothetical protein
MLRRWSVLATTAVSVIGIQTAQAAEISNSPAETAEVTVTGEATGSLTSRKITLHVWTRIKTARAFVKKLRKRTRFLPIVMRCWVSARDFDGPTDSPFFWIAGI